MLSLPPGIQVFMAIGPVDMRKSFDGLSAAVQAVFARDVRKRASPPVLARGVGCWGTNFTNPSGEVCDESWPGSGEAGGVGAAAGGV